MSARVVAVLRCLQDVNRFALSKMVALFIFAQRC